MVRCRVAVLGSLVLVLSACGGKPFAASVTSRTTPPALRPVGNAANIDGTGVATSSNLRPIVPTLSDMGPGWADGGDQPHSLDLDSPPTQCRTYAALLALRPQTLIHEFTYLPTSYGESGHAAFSVLRLRSASDVTRELSEVNTPEYAGCARATAVRWYLDSAPTPPTSVSVRRVSLPINVPHVVWRVALTLNPRDVYYVDIAYLGGGNAMVKARIGACGCESTGAQAALLPGETTSFEHISGALKPYR